MRGGTQEFSLLLVVVIFLHLWRRLKHYLQKGILLLAYTHSAYARSLESFTEINLGK